MLGTFIGGTKGRGAQGKDLFSLDVFNADERTLVRRVLITFLAHGAAFEPNQPERAVVFEKRGPGGAHIDWKRGEKLADISPSAGRAFYGHGAFSHDGAQLFVVETDLATHAGVITVRDGATFAVVSEFPTYGEDPHDCTLLADGETLVVTNAGGPLGTSEVPSLVFLDVQNRTLVERFVLEDKINAGHVALTPERGFAVCSAPRAGLPEESSVGGITLRRAGEAPARMTSPKDLMFGRLFGESLSVAIDGDTVIVTTPLADIATLWSLSSETLQGTLSFEFPRGVTLSRESRRALVSYGKALPKIALVDLDRREAIDLELASGVFSGSHFFLTN